MIEHRDIQTLVQIIVDGAIAVASQPHLCLLTTMAEADYLCVQFQTSRHVASSLKPL